ncbi:MAG TPA: gliding motility-associated C-terminal domain-containing protein, partial [Flavobacteriales bacterium]|nr:gliding motility-associated C-terminal domain-containing protein [Flavobacteriales bacterium]
YTVTITDACGNVAVVNITVNAQAVPHVWSATPVNIFCPNSATISPTFVSGGATPFSYSWSTGATTSSITVSPTDTTVYTVTITDVCDMVTVVNIPVNVQIVPQFWDPATFSTYCPFDPVTIGAEYVSGGTSPFTYSWSTGAITDSITVTPGDTTVYTVTITDACGETTTVPVTVDVRQPTQIEVSISSDTLCIQDGSVTLVPIVTNSNGGTVYTWSENGVPISNASTLVTTDLTTQTYVITVIDVCNSIDSDTSTVVIEACDITIPNIMTPNGDGLNEFWIITNLEKHPNTAVAIYNRWGQLMYENGAYQNNWDGGDVSDGVYFYVVTLTDGSTPANYHGTVQVARGN